MKVPETSQCSVSSVPCPISATYRTVQKKKQHQPFFPFQKSTLPSFSSSPILAHPDRGPLKALPAQSTFSNPRIWVNENELTLFEIEAAAARRRRSSFSISILRDGRPFGRWSPRPSSTSRVRFFGAFFPATALRRAIAWTRCDRRRKCGGIVANSDRICQVSAKRNTK